MPVAPVRAAPAEDAEQVTQLLQDEPVELELIRDGWARVRTAYDYPGWVREEAIEDKDGSLPAGAGGSPVDQARVYLGAPYLWGGMTEAGIDCSGLVHLAYRRLGVLVPRDAWQQAEAAVEVAAAEPGELVFYAEPGARIDHVAFWLGDGRILHATGRDGLGVVEEDEPPALELRRSGFGRISVGSHPR